jgi:hypothetical protein
MKWKISYLHILEFIRNFILMIIYLIAKISLSVLQQAIDTKGKTY